ncbi:MAG TPA: glycoside hydrolase family 97 N-terminal domain-containing protein, partial [Longimicrobiaceae bacterium]|nr:glycoside hydrolase family 97 N-terminal domain-containing protein [Longimicrobiaceae bacterium]
MQRRLRTLARPLALAAALAAGAAAPAPAQQELRVASPDGRNEVTVGTRDGGLYYAVRRNGKAVLLPSRLGFVFRGADSLWTGLRIAGSARDSADVTWTQPWGEVRRVRDHHRELRVRVEETKAPGRRFDVVFRAFDDGVGFRYELPEQPGLGAYELTDELTEFALADDARAWWIPSDRPRLDRSEMLYSSSPVSLLDSVQTPLTMQTRDGTFVVIHEANLVDYARMFLAGRGMESRTLRAALAPWANGVKVRG